MKQEKMQKQVKHTKKVEESLSYTVEVRDKEERIIQRISAPSRSYVQGWNMMVNIHTKPAGVAVPPGPTVIVKDVDGVDQNAYRHIFTLRANAVIGSVDSGILVGKGTTAVAITDYKLETPLGEGTGTDEFNHQATTFTEPAVVASTCSFTIKRIMINNSGATITGIREIGCYHWIVADSGVAYVLGFRDVLPGPVSVPHGGSITVTYTIKVTV